MSMIFFSLSLMFLVGCSFRPKIVRTTKFPIRTLLRSSTVPGGTIIAMIRISTASTMVVHLTNSSMEFAGDNSKGFTTHLNARR